MPTYGYVDAEYVDEPILRHTGTATTLPTTGDNALYYDRNQQYSIVGLTNDTNRCLGNLKLPTMR